MNDAHPQMNVEPVIDTANAEPKPPNPVHDMLTICGIANAVTRTTFINIEELDSVEAFASMNGDPNVTEMTKQMASRPNAAAGRVILGAMQIKRLQAI
jgi:hypothetical protein